MLRTQRIHQHKLGGESFPRIALSTSSLSLDAEESAIRGKLRWRGKKIKKKRRPGVVREVSQAGMEWWSFRGVWRFARVRGRKTNYG